MRVYTKEWHELSDYLSAVEEFEPIEDRDYSDDDIERLYQRALENYLNEYDLTLYDFYQNTGSRSLFRLKKWAGLIQDSRDVDDHVYNVITGLFHVNSAKLLDYWIRYIQGDHIPRSRNEVLMRNMLYYTFYKKCPAKMGFADIDEGIHSILCEDFVVYEVLEYGAML